MRFPLEIRLRPAWRVVVFLLAAHTFAGITLVVFMPVTWQRAAAALAVFLSAYHAVYHEARKRGVALQLYEDGRLTLNWKPPHHERVRVLQAVDFGWAIWLRLVKAGDDTPLLARKNLMLTPGNIPSGQWRVLRAWLRHKATKAQPAADRVSVS